ncbi:protease modulator HflK [Shinella sp. AETb1-6]|uniref:SPFH domain-containing protein n=1 Tax=Shinella sp. AETb1-6 TaxID=2692210 RepID=UPI00136DD26E|nr:SPFH domain-containing protein [Shinella sp. AETb1-6]MXN52817.1 protease modulator HflK [Shinella sp. AETb1-6]
MPPLTRALYHQRPDNADLPRFQGAAAQNRLLRLAGHVLLAACAILLISALTVAVFAPVSILVPVLYGNAGALLVLTAGLRSVGYATAWRQAALAGGEPDAEEAPPSEDERDWIGRQLSRILAIVARLVGPETVDLLVFSLAALLTGLTSWDPSLPAADPGTAASVLGAVALAAAFGLLVLERHFAAVPVVQWPEAAMLSNLARVPIAVLLMTAIGLFGSRMGSLWPGRLIAIAGLLSMLAALELFVCAVFGMFRPRDERQEPRALATSFVGGFLRWPPLTQFSALQEGIYARTGIDLRQVWAFSFMRRISLPVVLGIAVAGWLCTGLREVPMNGRGIYERFGRPEAVLGPGLHAGLPWPFGRLVAVEYGIVHELTAATLPPEGEEKLAPAEDAAPASADRLWDVVHPTEKSQIVASPTHDSQGFQLVDLDVRFFYRIGLSDEAALAAAYNHADLPALIRNVAGRVLVREFASRSLDEVVSAGRTALEREIASPLQAELDRLQSGVEIVAVAVEAVHPPAGAAAAYHGVQAAEIGARALVVRERGAAAATASEAETAAAAARDRAAATAHETLASANALSTRAEGERKAYAAGGKTFLLERYFEQLRKGLSQAGALIVDHRLAETEAPVTDLRIFTPPVDGITSNGTTEAKP